MPEEAVKVSVSEGSKGSPTNSGGAGSGIPKPMAAVKGMAKPTHCVAPMPQVTLEPNKRESQTEKVIKPLEWVYI